MVLQEQSQIKTTAYTTSKTVTRQTRLETATFDSCDAGTNKGVTDLNIELKTQKLDETDASNKRTSLRRIAFSQR